MKQHSKSELGQFYSDVKISVSVELEEKLKNVKPSAIKLEKALKATKTLNLEKLRAIQLVK